MTLHTITLDAGIFRAEATFSVDAEYLDRDPETGTAGGWTATAHLVELRIGDIRFVRSGAVGMLSGEVYVRGLEDDAAAEVIADLIERDVAIAEEAGEHRAENRWIA